VVLGRKLTATPTTNGTTKAPELRLAVGHDLSGGNGRQGTLATDLEQEERAPSRAEGQRHD